MSETKGEHTGEEVLKKIGELTQATNTLEKESESCETEPEEVGHWITTLGKAILGIFR